MGPWWPLAAARGIIAIGVVLMWIAYKGARYVRQMLVARAHRYYRTRTRSAGTRMHSLFPTYYGVVTDEPRKPLTTTPDDWESQQ
jgi:hypothetical protein